MILCNKLVFADLFTYTIRYSVDIVLGCIRVHIREHTVNYDYPVVEYTKYGRGYFEYFMPHKTLNLYLAM